MFHDGTPAVIGVVTAASSRRPEMTGFAAASSRRYDFVHSLTVFRD
jgi:hypothetical protein